MEVPAGVKAVGDLRRAENKILVQIDFVNLFQTSGSLMPVYLNTIQSGKKFSGLYNPQCTRKHNYITTQLKVNVIFPKKMGSRIRLPVLA